MSSQNVINMPESGASKTKQMDHNRIFRPEAIDAYRTRRAGEPWDARTRFEGWTITSLTITAIAAIVFLFLGR